MNRGALKSNVLQAIDRGVNVHTAAERFGTDPRTIRYWLRQRDTHGPLNASGRAMQQFLRRKP